MSTLGNLIWLIFGGFITGLGYIIGGLLLCLTIVGIPFGKRAIELGRATFAPFGKELVENPEGAGGCVSKAINLIWIILFGWEIALAHLICGVSMAVTIIGIPFAKQHFKLLPVALLPFRYTLQERNEQAI